MTCQIAPIITSTSADVTVVRFDTAIAGEVPCQLELKGEHLSTDATYAWLAHYGGDGDL